SHVLDTSNQRIRDSHNLEPQEDPQTRSTLCHSQSRIARYITTRRPCRLCWTHVASIAASICSPHRLGTRTPMDTHATLHRLQRLLLFDSSGDATPELLEKQAEGRVR